jgi:uncharacterized protein
MGADIHDKMQKKKMDRMFGFMKGNVRKFLQLVLLSMLFYNHSVVLAQIDNPELKHAAFVDSLNAVFSNPETSILDSLQRAHFTGIPFFKYDPRYRVTAHLKWIKNAQPIALLTSGERRPLYVPIALVTFKWEGKRQRLTLYSAVQPKNPAYADHVMLAFADLTNGFDSYGGGRYVDLKRSELKKEIVIDFNFAYNPYCAYVNRYSCVIPPVENRMDIKVNAGAKSDPHAP